jgi:SagB-type dehydrogenase family enzyme
MRRMTSGHMDYGVEVAERRAWPELLVLPPPQEHGGMPLLEALKQRRSRREFSRQELPLALLSGLLWAAFGINRPETSGRTAPSAHDWEEIDVYAATAQGLYVYRPREHALQKRLDADLRASTGLQEFVAEAPLDLVYVADLSRMHQASAEEKARYAGPDAGFIAQNVYLFCAAEGLATVVRGWLDRPRLARAMGLGPQQQIILAQTVGYPAAH